MSGGSRADVVDERNEPMHYDYIAIPDADVPPGCRADLAVTIRLRNPAGLSAKPGGQLRRAARLLERLVLVALDLAESTQVGLGRPRSRARSRSAWPAPPSVRGRRDSNPTTGSIIRMRVVASVYITIR
jgi:hypothetical protein